MQTEASFGDKAVVAAHSLEIAVAALVNISDEDTGWSREHADAALRRIKDMIEATERHAN